ncbi:MAG: hypothetical protein ABIG45_06300 [Bacillota bacterium]
MKIKSSTSIIRADSMNLQRELLLLWDLSMEYLVDHLKRRFCKR